MIRVSKANLKRLAAGQPAELSEEEFTDQVLLYAKARGWKRLHIRPARTKNEWRTPVQADGVGWPDLFMLRGKRMIAAELKLGDKAASPSQAAWLVALAEAGAECYVWHPDQWADLQKILE